MEKFNSPKKRVKVDETQSLTVLPLPMDLVLHIARSLIATQLARPMATKDLFNLALTCKALFKLIFTDVPNELGITQVKYIYNRFQMPAPSPTDLDTFKNVSWRVSFETDLCVLVLYRHDIVVSAVKRVALWAANYLNLNRPLGKVASKTALPENRFFGSMHGVKESEVTVDTAIDLLLRGDRIETMMVLLQMIHDHVVAKQHNGHLKNVPEISHFRTNDFERAKKQVQKTSDGKSAPTSQRFGITDSVVPYHDIPDHSFALGRVQRTGDRTRGFGRDQDNEGLPFVGGPSGSAVSLIRIGLAAGLADNDEHVRQYLLAIVVYLVGGGQHSVAEIMYGLAPLLTTLGYQRGRYMQLLPQSLLVTPEWARMLQKYGTYIHQL